MYLRLSRKDRCWGWASASGRTSSIKRSPFASAARRAPSRSAKSARRNGAFLAKNPGCCMALPYPPPPGLSPSNGRAAGDSKLGAETPGRLEARGGAETDQLLVVEALFDEGLGNVEPQGSERRFPDDAGARRGANGTGIGQANTRIGHSPGDRVARHGRPALGVEGLRALPGAVQRAGIDEGGRAHTELLRHEGNGKAHLRRGRPVGAAAQGVVGEQVARAKATPVKAANGFPTLVEQVDQAHVLA